MSATVHAQLALVEYRMTEEAHNQRVKLSNGLGGWPTAEYYTDRNQRQVGHARRLADAVEALLAENKRLTEELAEAEACLADPDYCPDCGAHADTNHQPGCPDVPPDPCPECGDLPKDGHAEDCDRGALEVRGLL